MKGEMVLDKGFPTNGPVSRDHSEQCDRHVCLMSRQHGAFLSCNMVLS